MRSAEAHKGTCSCLRDLASRKAARRLCLQAPQRCTVTQHLLRCYEDEPALRSAPQLSSLITGRSPEVRQMFGFALGLQAAQVLQFQI